MQRSQIQFEPEQAEALRKRAAAQGVSISAVVRDAVTQYLAGSQAGDRIERLLLAGGGFRSGLRDVSERHDAYLAEDFE